MMSAQLLLNWWLNPPPAHQAILCGAASISVIHGWGSGVSDEGTLVILAVITPCMRCNRTLCMCRTDFGCLLEQTKQQVGHALPSIANH